MHSNYSHLNIIVNIIKDLLLGQINYMKYISNQIIIIINLYDDGIF